MMNKDKVLAMLTQEWSMPEAREDELTTKDVSDALKAAGSKVYSTAHVSRKMKDLVGEGIVGHRWCTMPGGGRQYAYFPAEGKTWEDVLQYIKVN